MSEGLPKPFFAYVCMADYAAPDLSTAPPPPEPPRPRLRFINGSWPLRAGNTYPRFDRTRLHGPLGGYESYVRRSPPARS